jgi:hypothetical protein
MLFLEETNEKGKGNEMKGNSTLRAPNKIQVLRKKTVGSQVKYNISTNKIIENLHE